MVQAFPFITMTLTILYRVDQLLRRYALMLEIDAERNVQLQPKGVTLFAFSSMGSL